MLSAAPPNTKKAKNNYKIDKMGDDQIKAV